MTIKTIIEASACLFIGGMLCVKNWRALFLSKRERRASTVPFFGAGFLAVGLYFIPATSSFWWVALFADVGTLFFLVELPVIVRDFWRTSSFKLRHRFTTASEAQKTELRLYAGGGAVMALKYHGEMEKSLTLDGTWSEEGGVFRIDFGTSGPLLMLEPNDSGFLAREVNFSAWSDPWQALDGVSFQKLR